MSTTPAETTQHSIAIPPSLNPGDDIELRAGCKSGSQTPRDSLAWESKPNTRPSSRTTTSGSSRRQSQSDDHNQDGGLRAWIQVLVGHLVLFNSFGLIQSFGIFQPKYEDILHQSPSTVSWIGSVHIFFVYLMGTFSGRALDAGYYKHCLWVGLVLQTVGLMVASVSKTYWLAFLFHGVFQGIGHGLMFCPAVTNTAVYFPKRRMLAMSITSCGGATGGIVFPAIAKAVMPKGGLPWTLRAMGFVVLFNSILVCLLARSKSQPEHSAEIRRPFIDWRAFKDPSYALYVAASFFIFTALWIPYFYFREFTTRDIHVAPEKSFVILVIMNSAGLPGRLVPAWLADRYLGAVNTYILVLAATVMTLHGWLGVMNITGLYIWAAAYGFCAGGVASLCQAGIASLHVVGKEDGAVDGGLGVKIGMGFSVVAFASLLGAPVGGELIKAGQRMGEQGTFLWVQIFAWLVMMVGCVVMVMARMSKTGANVPRKL